MYSAELMRERERERERERDEGEGERKFDDRTGKFCDIGHDRWEGGAAGKGVNHVRRQLMATGNA